MKLTHRETEALDALADTFVPSLAFEKDEDPALFSMSASDLGVSALVAEALGRIDPAKRNAFRFFLRLLENPLFIAGVSSSASRFSRLPQTQREKVLQRLARSAVPQLRSAYQGARSLVMLHTYAANGTPESDALLSAIGYEPEINRRATAPHVPLTKLGTESTIECDVCVVGSGAAGSVVAAELAANGQNVLVVEAGSEWSGPDYDQHELRGMRSLFREGGASGTRDLSVSLFAGACIGGGTTVNWQSCFRTPDDVREEWAEISGCNHFTGVKTIGGDHAICAIDHTQVRRTSARPMEYSRTPVAGGQHDPVSRAQPVARPARARHHRHRHNARANAAHRRSGVRAQATTAAEPK